MRKAGEYFTPQSRERPQNLTLTLGRQSLTSRQTHAPSPPLGERVPRQADAPTGPGRGDVDWRAGLRVGAVEDERHHEVLGPPVVAADAQVVGVDLALGLELRDAVGAVGGWVGGE